MNRPVCLLSLLAAAAPAAAGPPDLLFTENPALGAFVDVQDLGGEPLDLADDGELELPIGRFAGNFVFLPGSVVAAQNGGLGFGNDTVTDLEAVNQPIPSFAAFIGGQAGLAFWDDIDDKEGDVSFVRLDAHPEFGDRLIVQWDWLNFDAAGSTLSFQVHILANFEPTGIYAQYMYRIEGRSTAAGGSATIGYQDGEAGFPDVQFSFEIEQAVTDGTVLSLAIPDPADIDRDGTVGILDFLLLLAGWGHCPDCEACPADLDGDCAVDIADALELLGRWGA